MLWDEETAIVGETLEDGFLEGELDEGRCVLVVIGIYGAFNISNCDIGVGRRTRKHDSYAFIFTSSAQISLRRCMSLGSPILGSAVGSHDAENTLVCEYLGVSRGEGKGTLTYDA